MGASDFDVKARIGDFLTNHFTHAERAEDCVGYDERDFSRGCHASRDARRILFRDTNVDVLVGVRFGETVGSAGFADVRIDNEDIFIFVAEDNHFLAEAVTSCDCLFFHIRIPPQCLSTRFPIPLCSGRLRASCRRSPCRKRPCLWSSAR